MNVFYIFIGAALINNYVLAQFLGMCPFFGVSKKTEMAFGMGLSVIFVMTLASILTHLVYYFVLVPLNSTYLQTIVFILIIASAVQFVEIYMKKSFHLLYTKMGIYIPLMTTNCAILGLAFINIQNKYTFFQAIVSSLGAGAGFLLTLVLLASIREKYDNHPDVPWIFQGFPLALFAAGLMSIAFLGFQGLVLKR